MISDACIYSIGVLQQQKKKKTNYNELHVWFHILFYRCLRFGNVKILFGTYFA